MNSIFVNKRIHRYDGSTCQLLNRCERKYEKVKQEECGKPAIPGIMQPYLTGKIFLDHLQPNVPD